MVPQLPIQHVNSFGEAFDHALVAASVTATGTVLGLLVNRVDASRVLARVDANGASFAETRVNPPYEATVVEHDGQRVVREVELVSSLAYPDVQTFHDGDILIAGARCRRFDDGTAEANAQIYTSAGELSAQFTIGDAVAHLRIDVHDQIWAGYTDEGIYGNYGWDRPIGAPGIVRFDRRGQIVWSYDPPGGGFYMDDCYSLNVAAEEAWTCFYRGFPIVRVRNDESRVWSNTVAGARALAISGDHALLVGGYKEDKKRAVVVHLDHDRAVPAHEYEIVLPDGRDLTKSRVVGVDSMLHFFAADGAWFQTDLAELLA